MQRYDKTATFSDFSTAWLYKKARITLIESLAIKKEIGSMLMHAARGKALS